MVFYLFIEAKILQDSKNIKWGFKVFISRSFFFVFCYFDSISQVSCWIFRKGEQNFCPLNIKTRDFMMGKKEKKFNLLGKCSCYNKEKKICMMEKKKNLDFLLSFFIASCAVENVFECWKVELWFKDEVCWYVMRFMDL